MIENRFDKSSEKWRAELRDGRKATLSHNAQLQSLEVASAYDETIYFVASGNHDFYSKH